MGTKEKEQKTLNGIQSAVLLLLKMCIRDRHMEEKAKSVGVLSTEDEDIRSLRELITYGLKGMACLLYTSRCV